LRTLQGSTIRWGGAGTTTTIVGGAVVRTISKICASLCGVLLAFMVLLGVMIGFLASFEYENGIYFDEATLVTYHEGTKTFLGILVAIGGVVFSFFFWLGRRILRYE